VSAPVAGERAGGSGRLDAPATAEAVSASGEEENEEDDQDNREHVGDPFGG
jgi:hypothetical protein